MSFTTFTGAVDNITQLPDRPNDELNMSGEDLRKEFDKTGAALKTYINGTLLSELEATTAGANIGVSATGITATTVTGALEELLADIGSAVVAGLSDDCVQTSYIQDAAVTTAKLNDGAVTTAKITDANVTTAKINDSAVTTAKLNNSAVTTGKIADGAVTEAKLGSLAVTTNKLGANAVTTAKILSAAVTADKLAANAVESDKIKASAVTTAKINDGAVTEDKIGSGAVTAGKIGSGAVTAAKIGTGAVTSGKLGSGAVIDGKLDSNCVNTANIKDGQVTYAKTSGVQAQHRFYTKTVSKITTSNGTTTVTCGALTDDYNIIVSPAPDNFIAWRDCGLRCSARSGTTLTFTAETPMSSSMTAYIMAFLGT